MMENWFVDFMVDFITSGEFIRHLWMQIDGPVCKKIQDRIDRLLSKKRQHRSSCVDSSEMPAVKSAGLDPHEELLLEFTKKYQIKELERLLAQGVSPNICDREGCTPMIDAARMRCPGMLQLLINNSTLQTVNWGNCEKQTALMHAARVGCLASLRMLLAAGADVNLQDKRGNTALMLASSKGHHDEVDMLLAHGECLLNLQNNCGHSALHEACTKGFLVIVLLLVCSGADTECRDNWLNTPLFYATLQGHTNIVAYLLKNKCDPNAINKGGRSALHTASQKGFCRIVELLLHHGAHTNVIDKEGYTPLLQAAFRQQDDVALRLLEVGCDVHLTDRQGKGALHYAACNGSRRSVNLLEALIQHGVHPDVADKNGCTALVHAMRGDHVEVVRCLLSHNCNVNIQPPLLVQNEIIVGSGLTSLFALTLRNGSSAVLPLLIEAGCDTSSFVQCQQMSSISHVISEDVDLMTWLDVTLSNPMSLQSLCRLRIRSSLSIRIREELETFNIPAKFKDFILFQKDFILFK